MFPTHIALLDALLSDTANRIGADNVAVFAANRVRIIANFDPTVRLVPPSVSDDAETIAKDRIPGHSELALASTENFTGTHHRISADHLTTCLGSRLRFSLHFLWSFFPDLNVVSRSLFWSYLGAGRGGRMPNSVIVDDQSSQITYTGLWTGGGTAGHYSHTASSSRASGATMTFQFSGTSVSVVGSFDAKTSCTGTFSLDANLTTFVSPALSDPLNHQTIWISSPLPDAPHTLTYTLSSCSSSNDAPGYVWFDYILYIPSTNASTNGFTYFVDDRDSRLDYSGNWTAETNNTGAFELTSHGGLQGSAFGLEFEGTSVSVYGRIENDSAGVATQASFSIDGAAPRVFAAPFQNTISYNQPLFQSDTLVQGKHTLVVNPQSGTLWVDYLLLRPGPSTDNTTLSSTHHSSVNIGEIAAVALGGLALAIGIVLLVIFRKRLFKGRYSNSRSAAPSRPLSRPPNIHVVDAREAASSNHLPWQSGNIYPPTIANSSYSIRSNNTRNPFDTPPMSPRSGTYAASSSGDSNTDHNHHVANGPSASPSWPTSYASSSGHSRRMPSLGGDGDSVADLKRRQQLAILASDDNLSIASSHAVSRASSVRPLPVIPPEPIASGSGYVDDDAPPVYTVR